MKLQHYNIFLYVYLSWFINQITNSIVLIFEANLNLVYIILVIILHAIGLYPIGWLRILQSLEMETLMNVNIEKKIHHMNAGMRRWNHLDAQKEKNQEEIHWQAEIFVPEQIIFFLTLQTLLPLLWAGLVVFSAVCTLLMTGRGLDLVMVIHRLLVVLRIHAPATTSTISIECREHPQISLRRALISR